MIEPAGTPGPHTGRGLLFCRSPGTVCTLGHRLGQCPLSSTFFSSCLEKKRQREHAFKFGELDTQLSPASILAYTAGYELFHLFISPLIGSWADSFR